MKFFGLMMFIALTAVADAAPEPSRIFFPKFGRQQHTATTLPNGEILMVGGSGDANDLIATPEIYNPFSQEWTMKAQMLVPRQDHSAVLLQNGTVLVFGGYEQAADGLNLSNTDSVESYDPILDVWTAKAPMMLKRAGGVFTATRLNDGRVLIAGGVESGTNTRSKSAEIYTPSTDSWTLVAPMNFARDNQTATLLADGRVLLMGVDKAKTASAEIYDPATNTWTVKTAPPQPQVYATATLLPDGTVLVVGGFDPTKTGAYALDVAIIYNPSTDYWQNAGKLAQSRGHHRTLLTPSGDVLVTGGYATGWKALDSAELYHPATNTWTTLPAMHSVRYSHSVNMAGTTKALVFGGLTSSLGDGSPTFEVLDLSTLIWAYSDYPTTKRGSHTATLLTDGRVLLVGGNAFDTYQRRETDSVELYDPATNTFTPAAPLNTARAMHSAIRLMDGKVLVIGGMNMKINSNGPLASVELYDPVTNTWTVKAPMNEGRHNFGLNLLNDGRVLVTGGSGSDGYAPALKTVEIYDPLTDTWLPGAPMSDLRVVHSATLLLNGQVLVVGGYSGWGGRSSSSVELYDPTSNSWTPRASLAFGRDEHSAHLMPDGNLIIIGGVEDNAGKRNYTQTVLSYNIANDVWSQRASFADYHDKDSAIELPGSKIMIIGGDGSRRNSRDFGSRIETYDYNTDQWTAGAKLYDKRNHATATLLSTGKIFVHGGYQSEFGILPFHELIQP